MKFDLNDEQKMALCFLRSGKNFFLTGKAGTGKTTVIREFQKENKNMIFLAPTALAAGALKGETIHHFFGIPAADIYAPDSMTPLTDTERIKMLQMASVIVIDEVSMLRSDLFACVDQRLRQCALPEDHAKPFGGKQIVLVGDLFQLPPIVKPIGGIPVEEYLREKYGGKFVYQGPLWRESFFQVICLKTVMRQNDPAFIGLLNRVRYGIVDSNTKGLLDQRVYPIEPLSDSITRLCATRKEAKKVNDLALAGLGTEPVEFQARISGNFPESDYPLDETVLLYPGERVMFTKNERLDDGLFLYKNGEYGQIVSVNQTEACVRLANGEEVSVTAACYPHFSYRLEQDEDGADVLCSKEDGHFRQIPLIPAYAVTIHKAQGMTLEQAVISPRGCFQPGQLYTALSRCRSLEGVYLTASIDHALCDPEIIRMYDIWEYSEELFLDTLQQERERFGDAIFPFAFPRSDIQYGEKIPLLCWLKETCEVHLKRQRRGEQPPQRILSDRERTMLRQIRLYLRILDKNGCLNEWEYSKLVSAFLNLKIFVFRAA